MATDVSAQVRLSMAEALKRARASSLELRSRAAEVDAKQGEFWQAVSPEKPEVFVSFQDIPSGAPLGNQNKQLGISQRVDFPSKYFTRGAVAGAETEKTRAELSEAAIEISAKVRTGYISAVATAELARVSETSLRLADTLLSVARKRRELGEAGSVELLQAQLERATAARQWLSAKTDSAKALAELRLLLLIPQGERLELTDSLQNHFPPAAAILTIDLPVLQQVSPERTAPADPMTVEQTLPERTIPASMLATHPKVRQAASVLSASESRRTLAWSNLLPDFTLQYFQQTFGGNPNFYGATLQASVPLWFLLGNRGEIQSASALTAKAASLLTQTEQSIAMQYQTSLLSYDAARMQAELFRSQIQPQAELLMRSARASYEAGNIGYLELLTAQRTYLNAQAAAIQSRADAAAALVRLRQAAGLE